MLQLVSRVLVADALGDGTEAVVETYADPEQDPLPEDQRRQPTVVSTRKPSPRVVLSVDKRQVLADGVNEATITATFQSWSLVDGEGVWSRDIPAGDVTFIVNLRPTTVSVGPQGTAVLSLTTTVPGHFHIRASLSGYGDATEAVEAIA